MIAADITYLRPDTAEEAVDAWSRHEGARYLAGGTEITTSARRTAAYDLRACIDFKRFAEVNVHELCDAALYLIKHRDAFADEVFAKLSGWTVQPASSHTG